MPRHAGTDQDLLAMALVGYEDLLQIRPDDVKDLPYSEWN